MPLPKVIKPYINSLSFNLSSSVAFSTMTSTELTNSDVAPEDFNEWKLKNEWLATTNDFTQRGRCKSLPLYFLVTMGTYIICQLSIEY